MSHTACNRHTGTSDLWSHSPANLWCVVKRHTYQLWWWSCTSTLGLRTVHDVVYALMHQYQSTIAKSCLMYCTDYSVMLHTPVFWNRQYDTVHNVLSWGTCATQQYPVYEYTHLVSWTDKGDWLSFLCTENLAFIENLNYLFLQYLYYLYV